MERGWRRRWGQEEGGPVAAGTDFRGGDRRGGRTCTRRRRRRRSRRGKPGGPVSRRQDAPGFLSVGSKFPRCPWKFFSSAPHSLPAPGSALTQRLPAARRCTARSRAGLLWPPGRGWRERRPGAATERIPGGQRGGEKRRFGARPRGGAQAPQSPVREGGPGGPTLVGRGGGVEGGAESGAVPHRRGCSTPGRGAPKSVSASHQRDRPGITSLSPRFRGKKAASTAERGRGNWRGREGGRL